MTAAAEPLELSKARMALAKQDKRAKAAFGYAATSRGRSLTVRYLPEVIKQVQIKLSRVPKQGTPDYELERVLRQLDPAVIGLVCLSGVLMATARRERYHTKVLIMVGEDLEAECFAEGLLQSNKKLAGRINRAAAIRHSTAAQRRSAARYMAEKANGFQMEKWSDDKRAEAGAWAFNVVLAALPDVFRWDVRDGLRYPTLHEAAAAEAEQAAKHLFEMNPIWQPRATCPAPWTGWTNRVAESPEVRPVALVKTYYKDTEIAIRAAIASGQAAPALKGLNSLQSVPFKINEWVLGVIKAVKEQGGPALPDISTVAPRDGVSLQETQKLNRRHNGDRTRMAADIGTAERCAAQGVFYIPMHFEWRSRVNSIPMFNYQREDYVRALFLFKEGKPIGQKGIHWLKVHLANCGDFEKVSKKSFEDRLAWTEANMDRIQAAAADPMADDWWQSADCPFLFLAACKELVEALAVGPEYISHLPAAWDGACNGLQHLSMMTRGLEEGRHVNLTDNDAPADIYQLVADEVAKMVEVDKVSNIDPIRKYSNMLAAYGVNRRLVKRCVMTMVYGSKEFGMGNHIITDTMDAEQEKVVAGKLAVHPFGAAEDQRGAARYIASRTYDAILRIVGRPAEAMKLFQDCASRLAHEYKVLSWVTPAGMPLINRYHEMETRSVRLWLHDRGVSNLLQAKITIGHTAKVDRTRVKNGAAANITHACDASHLLLTAGACADEGIQLATVHDSYATHLCDTDRMLEILKGEFVRMYTEHDVLAEVLASAAADFTGDKKRQLPTLPEKGKLDLNEVKRARYAFA